MTSDISQLLYIPSYPKIITITTTFFMEGWKKLATAPEIIKKVTF